LEAVIDKVAREQYGPLLGLATSVLGTLAALLLFPEDPTPQGALVVPGTLLAISIIFVPAMRVLTGSSTMMNADNFVAVGYVGWLLLDLIQGAYDLSGASKESLRYALVAVGVSASAMWAGSIGKPWPVPKWLLNVASRPLESRAVERLIPICFFLGMLNYMYSVNFNLVEMFSYLGAARFNVPWGRGQLGGWGSFIDQMPYFGYVLPSLTALVIARRGMSLQTLFAVLASAIMLLFLAQSGGRRIILVTVGAALIVWVQAQPGMKFRKVFAVGVVSIAMVYTMQFMLNVRGGGYQEYLYTGGQFNDYLHVDDNFLRLAQIIQIVPERRDYVYHRQVTFTLIRPIPRVLWPGKPIGPGFDLPSEVGMKGVSLSSSIIGEWYLSWGWVAVVFGGWFHGRLAGTASTLRDHGMAFRNPIVYALAVMVLVAGLRSMQDLVIMSYALVAWWGANRMVSSRSPQGR
jgi:oligosaccharide repeat unit polymerase